MSDPDPLADPRPAFEPGLVADILADRYGMAGELTELHGERDRNFRVDTAAGRRYLLKIHHPADPIDVVEMRTLAMAHARRFDAGLPFPEVVPTSSGKASAAATAPDGRVSEVQLFTFLEGRHATGEELDAGTLFDWGRCVARLGRALRGYFHPAAGYPIQWDLRHAAALGDRLDLLGGEARELVGTTIDRFVAHVAPRFGALRAQVVHNDMSRENVLVDDRCSIVGITDFGDTTHTALVCDLAVAVADVLDGRPDSLEMAEPMIAGYRSLTPLEPAEARVLADLVAARAATAVVVTAWRAELHGSVPQLPAGALDLLRLIAAEGFDRVAARLERAASPDGNVAGMTPAPSRAPGPAAPGPAAPADGMPPYAPRESGELAAARRKVLGALELSYEEPLHLVRGEGVHLFDARGRRYLDAYNNVPVVGHSHPAVAAAIAAQARLLVTNTRYLHESSVALAERLLERAPGSLERVLFVNSGSEANDVAWRIARIATGGRGALVTRFAYHGMTTATADLSPEEWPEGYAPAHVGLLVPPGGAGSADAAGVLRRLASAGHAPPAALFADPAFTSDGILGPAHDWIAVAAAAVRSAGGLFVADEVQAGYGRTGEALWSISPSGVQPDLMTLGKPMGNGFPVAAVLGRAQLVDPFVEATGYFSTFGGNTLACVAGLAVLRVIDEERLVERAASAGAHLRERLAEVAARHGAVGGLRGWGLLLGLDIVGHDGEPDPLEARRVVSRLRRSGVLVGTTGQAGNVLKIRPPLVFGTADGEELAERLDDALSESER